MLQHSTFYISLKNRIKYLISGEKKRWSFDDYLFYHMQDMDRAERASIMSLQELEEAEKLLNKDSHREIFNSKRRFYETFHPVMSDYIKRDIFFLRDHSYEEYRQFLSANKKCILKPDNMYAGLGIDIVDCRFENADYLDNSSHESDDKNSEAYILWKEYFDKNYLAEELLESSAVYSSIYPESLNTMRITTLLDDEGVPHVIGAANQFGSRGSIVDNDDNSSIWANINVDTGIVDAVDTDERTGLINELHPDTRKPILGFENPHFDEVKELACQAALIVPECRLIGWDIARLSDGRLEIIEGNVTPELNLFQSMTGKGLKNVLMNQSIK